MHTKSIIAGAAIALVASLGSASAAAHFEVTPPGRDDPGSHTASVVAAGFTETHGGVVATGKGKFGETGSFQGGHLQNAEDASGGVIDVCGSGEGC